ncbi:MAG: spore cortex biosynthesis protein YabQ [Clostridia bacterium]|nr:spore cortex biosynthesis protein YabQ [Clostridia bacterium]
MAAYKIFIILAGCGVASGVLYDLFYVLRSLICGMPAETFTLKGRVAAGIADAIYLAFIVFLFVFCSVYFGFPYIRLYMIAAILCGIALYIKSFHKTVAFFIKKLYNKRAKR